MINRFSGSVLFIDNVCLVYLLDDLYYANKDYLLNTISILALEYDQIWIPTTVKKEFLLRRNDRKRQKLLNWIMDRFSAIQMCPINVSRNEIVTLIGNKEENAGEADAILQMKKSQMSVNHELSRMTFFSQDKGAIQLAQDHGYEVLDYNEFKVRLYESGIVLP